MTLALIILILSAILLLVLILHKRHRTRALERLDNLVTLERELLTEKELLDVYNATKQVRLDYLRDRLGTAGCLCLSERKKFIVIILSMPVLLTTAFWIVFGILGLFVGFYVGAGSALFYYRHRTRNFTREVLYRLPLVLESFILLVESGLGILPAMEKLVSTDSHSGHQTGHQNPVLRILNLVYQLTAHGIPFHKAAKMVANACSQRTLRHVLLHLDISGSEGGEVIPSLKSLSDHAHSEWKQSVHLRVKRLENMVVFPVFASVIGLLILAAAAPLSDIMDFKKVLTEKNTLSAIDTNALNIEGQVRIEK